MLVDYTQFLALVYADLFDFPLTKREMNLWEVVGTGPKTQVELKDEFLFLKGRRKLVHFRREREKISKSKLAKLTKIIEKISEIETIEAVFLTGSVSVLNATLDSDVDLMIVTKPGTLWQTRLKLLALLRKLNMDRNKSHTKDRVCTNMFLDSDHLEINERNLYTAHEIVQAKCIFDRGGIEKKWINDNLWVRDFLPNAIKNKKDGKEEKVKKNLSLIEIAAFVLQYLYMKPKITSEKVGLGYAFFHPIDGSKFFLQKFEKRLSELKR